MKHSAFRKFLFILLGLSLVFAAAAWFLPYDWKPDPGARFRTAASQLKRDRSNYWLNIHLKKSGDANHDLLKPVRLILADGRELEPADTTFAGEPGVGTTAVWFLFWLEESDLTGPLSLKLNDGNLTVKSTNGVPAIANATMRTFSTHRW